MGTEGCGYEWRTLRRSITSTVHVFAYSGRRRCYNSCWKEFTDRRTSPVRSFRAPRLKLRSRTNRSGFPRGRSIGEDSRSNENPRVENDQRGTSEGFVIGTLFCISRSRCQRNGSASAAQGYRERGVAANNVNFSTTRRIVRSARRIRCNRANR